MQVCAEMAREMADLLRVEENLQVVECGSGLLAFFTSPNVVRDELRTAIVASPQFRQRTLSEAGKLQPHRARGD